MKAHRITPAAPPRTGAEPRDAHTLGARRRALRNVLWQRLLDLAEARPTRQLVRRAGRLLARAHRARVRHGDRLRAVARRLLGRAPR
ncbi:MAG: hypothetical protein H6701_03125 [Myxococcales bacterium]|nr:hypothetical protein [Myxococcales bacterium]MCB9550532.1 hypothetical protein [Myxococcales bacterium]